MNKTASFILPEIRNLPLPLLHFFRRNRRFFRRNGGFFHIIPHKWRFLRKIGWFLRNISEYTVISSEKYTFTTVYFLKNNIYGTSTKERA